MAARAEVLVREKVTDEDGNLYELVVWKVPVAPHYPEGVRYRSAFVPAREDEPLVLYDNHRPKGHHRHFRDKEEQYAFVGVDGLIDDFFEDVREVRGHK